MLSAHKGHHCQHRSDDFPTIAGIVAPHAPKIAVELGTDEGGFAGWLADLLMLWGGRVVTFDRERKFKDGLLETFPNLTFTLGDVLTTVHPDVEKLISQAGVLLYCDDGNKQREIELYGPHLGVGSLLAVHDYGTEVDPAWVEPFVAALGYEREGHERMEALANEWYQQPMTRIWRRTRRP